MPFFVHGGRRLYYREQGEGPLLLVLPGNTATSASHTGEVDYYSQRFQVVSMDFWGTGQSDRVDQFPLDWFQIAAADAAALAAHLSTEKAIWLGVSGGGVIALLAAIHYPERVRAVIVDSTAERLTDDWFKNFIADRAKRSAGQIHFWSSAQGDNWQQVIDADTNFLSRLPRQGGDLYDGRLKEIGCPVLFTASLQDQLIPDVGGQVLKMASQISASQVFITNQGGHPLMWSCPALFRQVSDMFIAGLPHEHKDA